jgi:hypothetical protein
MMGKSILRKKGKEEDEETCSPAARNAFLHAFEDIN